MLVSLTADEVTLLHSAIHNELELLKDVANEIDENAEIDGAMANSFDVLYGLQAKLSEVLILNVQGMIIDGGKLIDKALSATDTASLHFFEGCLAGMMRVLWRHQEPSDSVSAFVAALLIVSDADEADARMLLQHITELAGPLFNE